MPDSTQDTSPLHPAGPHAPLLVGLGASAGGIKALKQFFAHVPPDTGATYVVILHLSPSHDSRLAEVLQMTSSMPVTQVTARTSIASNRVYVVPPNKSLEIQDDTLIVSEVTRVEQRRAPVDVFFRALADAHGCRAICIILSGTGHDGSIGLKRVKEQGGLAIAQDPGEAEFGDMPRSAIATGLVDFVLPVSEMPAHIRGYGDRLPRDDGEVRDLREPPDDAGALGEILTLLRARTGQDFSNYKPGTLQRRIARRIHVRDVPSLQDYATLMRHHPEEASALMKDLLISVTTFFRDSVAFDVVASVAIPRMFANKAGHDQVRAWVPACATGEEAYSIAMLMAEHAATLPDPPAMQVFATDLDQVAISIAREGLYSDADAVDVSEERLNRFFQRETAGLRIRRDLRERVLFAHHNVIRDPPFSRLDVISCRNVLIYLNRSIQQRVVETFHFALRPGGFLFLGGAESPDGLNDLFLPIDKAAHLYESRTVATRSMPIAAPPAPIIRRPAPRSADAPAGERISPADLHQRLLEEYAPPSLVVSDEHHVVHMSARVGRYLRIPGGEPSRDLLQNVRPELRPDLSGALHHAARERVNVEVSGIAVAFDDGTHRVDVKVRPILGEGDPARGFLLVTFAEHETAEPDGGVALQPSSRSEPAAIMLEQELTRVKVQLRGTIEQYETQVEEAKASNEELQAMNEELRSAAEELETSKEELQSVNEELTTVNQELKIKIEELGLTNNDFQNLINSTDIGTIFLDRDLRVKMSTPSAREIFNLLHSDTGRPLSDITSQLLYEGLHDDVRRVLDHLQTIDREAQTRDGRWHLIRLRPYRTTDDRIEGVVITFQDITGRRHAELQVRESEERLRLLIDSVIDYAIFTVSNDGLIDSWNAGAERMFGFRADEIVGSHVEVLSTAEDRAAEVPAAELDAARRNGRAADERLHVRKDGTTFHCSSVTTRLGGTEGRGFAKVARDLSAPRSAADAVRSVRAEVDALVRERTGELEAELHQHAAAELHVVSLLRKIVTAQEDERARIARDLHDQLGQQLTALRLTLEQHKQRLIASGLAPDDVERALKLAHDIDREVDFLAWELRPAVLDDLGLAAALPRFVHEWSAHYGIAAEYHDHGFRTGSVSRDAEVVFYRVAQEALTNVTKHSHASRADVMLEVRDDSVVLVIEDDGIGFDPMDYQTPEKGIGLIGMRERAATIGGNLQIESAPGEGTSIFLRCAISGSAMAATDRE